MGATTMADLGPIPATVSDRDLADAWLYAVLADDSLSAGLKASAALLRLRLNASTWFSSPSLEGWAADTAQNRRAVQKHRDDLEAAGLLRWTAKRGRSRNDYELVITSAVQRMLIKTNPRRAAEVGLIDNTARAEVGTSQPPPSQQPTSALAAANLRRTALRTLSNPNNPYGSAPARGPTGAPDDAAQSLKPVEVYLRQKMGDEPYETWLIKTKAQFIPGPPGNGCFVISNPGYAKHVRTKFGPAFEEKGWEIVSSKAVAA